MWEGAYEGKRHELPKVEAPSGACKLLDKTSFLPTFGILSRAQTRARSKMRTKPSPTWSARAVVANGKLK